MELQQLMNHFFALYGPRNRVFLDSLMNRVGFLSIAVVDLGRAVRKQVAPEFKALAISRVVSRIFCVAECFRDDFPFVETLCRKYSSVCPYCLRTTCACDYQRPDAKLTDQAAANQLQWSLTDWCRHLNQLYGTNNARQPIEVLIGHLHEETVEVLSLVMKSPNLNVPAATILQTIADELSDTLGWAIGIANVLEVDLESQLLERYYPNCWKCKKNPCECGPFSHQQVDWHQLAITQETS